MGARFCIRCGNPLVPNARFCMRCGSPVAVAPSPASATPSPPGSSPPTLGGVAAGLGVPAPRRRPFYRTPFGIIVIVVVAIAVVLAVLFTVPVSHSVRYSAPVSNSGTYTQVALWTWSFPVGVNVTIAWSGPTGATTILAVSMFAALAILYNVSGTSGSFSFTASALPYVFQASTTGGGPVSGTLDVTASYRAPIL